jgi:glucose-1-phosphatase
MNSGWRPEFVYFDLGNVLVNFDHAIAVRQVAELTGVATDKVRHLIFESGLQDKYETGLVSSQEFVVQVERALNMPLDQQKLLDAISSIFHPNLEILEPLRWLRERGFRLGVLSNTCEAHWQWLKRQQYPILDDWFELDVLSFEVGAMKPSPVIYQKAAEMAGVRPESIFFTDDRSDNIAAAINAGWTAVQFTNAKQLQSHLVKWS